MAFSKGTLRTAGLLCEALTDAGFVSVFEHIKVCQSPGDHVFTLWANLSTGEENLSVVDGRGNYSVYRLEQISTFPLRAPAEATNDRGGSNRAA